MSSQPSLGRLVTVHPVAPVVIQRAVFIAVLSFLFFLGMMFAYYLRKDIGYFLLATAFLLVYLAMMFSIVTQRKSTVEVFERGVRLRRVSVAFSEVTAVSDGGEITLKEGGKLQLPKSVVDLDQLTARIRKMS